MPIACPASSICLRSFTYPTLQTAEIVNANIKVYRNSLRRMSTWSLFVRLPLAASTSVHLLKCSACVSICIHKSHPCK